MSGGCICRGVAGSGIWRLSNDSRQLAYRPVVMGNYKRCNKEMVQRVKKTKGSLIDRGENQGLPEPYEINSGSGSRVFSVALVLCFNGLLFWLLVYKIHHGRLDGMGNIIRFDFHAAGFWQMILPYPVPEFAR